MSHNHSGGCAHEATDADLDPLEMGISYSLFQKIDILNLETLGEAEDESGKLVFKAYENRLDSDKFVESDIDPELLFNIPFTGNVKLKGLIIIGSNNEEHPRSVRLFKNRPKMSFDDANAPPDQEFVLEKDPYGTIEYNTKVVTFSNVHHLSLYFPENFGGIKTRICYIGLRGEFTEAHHHGVTICTYESRPNMSDHKNDLFDKVNHQIQ